MRNEWTERIKYLESCLRAADYNVQENQLLLDQAWKENTRLAEEIEKLKTLIAKVPQN
jgi:hypothetical protein